MFQLTPVKMFQLTPEAHVTFVSVLRKTMAITMNLFNIILWLSTKASNTHKLASLTYNHPKENSKFPCGENFSPDIKKQTLLCHSNNVVTPVLLVIWWMAVTIGHTQVLIFHEINHRHGRKSQCFN